MGLTEEEECTANAASRFINILFFISERRGFQSRQKIDFWMHSINTSVSFHSRPNSGLLFSVDNSKKLSGNYMDYLVEYSFISFWRWPEPVGSGVLFSSLLPQIISLHRFCFWTVVLFCFELLQIYIQYVGEVTYSFLFILLTNKPKPIEEGIQKG